MEPEAKYTVVGASVLVLVALLVASLMWLRSSGAGSDARSYRIHFVRESLGGLRPRGDVLMRGIRVGEVASVRFSTFRPGTIDVVVALDPTTPVRADTRAVLERNLLTGIAAIELQNPSEQGPLSTEAPPGEDLPVIAEGESAMQEVSSTLNQLAQRADDAVLRLNDAFSPANRAALAETIENLRVASRHADATLTKADGALRSVGAAAGEVGALATSVRADAHRLTGDASESVGEIATAARRITADADRLTARLDAAVAGGSEDVRSTVQALRSAADSVAAAAERLRQPQNVIYGPVEGSLGPGEGAR